MAAKAPEMTADFARWYADAFMIEGTTREKRWKGVVDVAAKDDWRAAEVLVRLAFPTSVPAGGTKTEDLGDAYQAVLTTIAGGGAPLDPTQSARELQVLAAAALAQAFAGSADAAIAVCTASFGGARKPELPMDLPALAERALEELALKRHDRINEKDVQSNAPNVDFAVSAEAQGSMEPALWKGELDRLRVAAATAISSVVSSQNDVAIRLHRQAKLDQEELQMLWWLIGEHSRVSNASFANVTPNARPLVFGCELARMTSVSPGPVSVQAMLIRAGVAASDVSVEDIINAVGLDWAKERSQAKAISPVTTPLHFALEKRGEVGTTDSWQPGWAGITGISPDLKRPAIDFALQFYREFLFLHVGS